MIILRFALIISSILIASTMQAMNKQLAQQQKNNNNRPWKITDSKAPKFPAYEISEPIRARTTNSASAGIIADSIYGSRPAQLYTAVADLEQSRALSRQSAQIGAPLGVHNFYTMSYAGRKITQELYDGVEASTDKTALRVGPQSWNEIQKNLPDSVKRSLAITVELGRTPEQEIFNVAACALKGSIIGASGAATISLAQNTPHNVIDKGKETLWANKERIASEITARGFQTIKEHGTKAIDGGLAYATERLNNIDINPVGDHCSQAYSHEAKFFTDVVKHAGTTLKNELLYTGIFYGAELALEIVPGAVFNSNNIDSGQVYAGALTGGTIGLIKGIATIGNPIQKAPLSQIF